MEGKSGKVNRAFNRVLLFTLDGVGVGALPDADRFGDSGAQTVQAVARFCSPLELPNLARMGLGQIPGLEGLFPCSRPEGLSGRMVERSGGKDSTAGHWELAGLVQADPLPTFPDGFPEEIMTSFREETGTDPLGNINISGTAVIEQLGEEHCRTGRPIVYTSVDSVFQIAAHEAVIPLGELYNLCQKARHILDPYRVGRVIARPFVGESAATFRRTSRRKDFSLKPPKPTMLERLSDAGLPSLGVGKIYDLFAGKGVSGKFPTKNNSQGVAESLRLFGEITEGLVFCNLLDFDMMYGHRNDVAGFGRALRQFDRMLPDIKASMGPEDLLLLTADHGCDPTWPGTDHTREYVPLLGWYPGCTGGLSIGTRESFADVAATVLENFGLSPLAGKSFLSELVSLR